MRLLLITGNKNYFDDTSEAWTELVEAAKHIEQIHIIVLTKSSEPYEMRQVGERIFVYPTRSRSRWLYARDAATVADRQIVMASQLVVDIIEARDPFDSALAAYLISRKHKKNFLITAFENPNFALAEMGYIEAKLMRKAYLYSLARAQGVRVSTQAVGEAICAEIPELENRTYILNRPLVVETQGAASEETIDLRKRYPDFNLFLLASIESKSRKNLARLERNIANLRLRYPRAGLIIIDNYGFYGKRRAGKKTNSGLIWESQTDDLAVYARSVHAFMDVSNDTKPGGVMTEAALMGCPIVAAESPASSYLIRNGENGFIADPDDLAGFAGRIVEIFETPGLRERIRLERYETNKLYETSREEYWPSIMKVYDLAISSENQVLPGQLEEYASGFVHTMESARGYAAKVAEKLDTNISNIKEKVTAPRKPLNRTFGTTGVVPSGKEDLFDVDKVLK